MKILTRLGTKLKHIDMFLNDELKNTSRNVMIGLGLLFFVIAFSGCIVEKQTEIRYIQVTPETRYVYEVPKTTPTPTPLSTLSSDIRYSLQEARNDFSWRLNLLDEQQRRIDMLYAIKTGVVMQQQEYKAWIDSLVAAFKEYYVRLNNAVNSGQSYANLLNANIDSLDTNYYNSEINWIKKNYDIISSDYNINKENVNKVVDRYNNCFVYKTGCA